MAIAVVLFKRLANARLDTYQQAKTESERDEKSKTPLEIVNQVTEQYQNVSRACYDNCCQLEE